MNALVHLLEKLINLIARQTSRRQADINLATDYEPGRNFQLYVGVAGIVKGLDSESNPGNRYFIAGYHPILFRKISSSGNGTAATDLAALF